MNVAALLKATKFGNLSSRFSHTVSARFSFLLVSVLSFSLLHASGSQTDLKGSPTDARVLRGSWPEEIGTYTRTRAEGTANRRADRSARGADRRLAGVAGSHDLSVSVFAHKSTRTGRCRFFWAVTNQLQ